MTWSANLRRARQRAGLSQATVAERMGSTQSAVARIETGNADPRLSTVLRFLNAVGAEAVVEPAMTTLASLATRLMTYVHDGDVNDAFRLGVQFVDELMHVPATERFSAIAEEPAPTGDRRWDAFFGGLAEHAALRYTLRVPGWASAPGRFIDQFWFLIEEMLGRPAPGIAAMTFADPAPAFASRGVFIDRGSLITV